MRVCIHRGSKEIGGSCVEIESAGQRLLLDFGLPLDADRNTAKYLPEISGLDGNDDSLLGILISHPHLDHFGLLEDVSPNVNVGIRPDAKRILETAASFLRDRRPISLEGWAFKSNESIEIGP